jgi:hypothetical protein
VSSPWAWLMASVVFGDGGRPRLGEDVQAASRRTCEQTLGIFALALQRARALGEFQPGVQTGQVALALLGAMRGIEFPPSRDSPLTSSRRRNQPPLPR